MLTRIVNKFTSTTPEEKTSRPTEPTSSSYIKFFNDGISIGDPSLRLSNMSAAKAKRDFVYTATFLLSIMNVITLTGASTYFYDQNRTTDYRYDPYTDAFNQFGTNISKAMCGADPRVPQSDVSANYEQLKWWGGNHNPTSRGALFRGAGETPNEILESCIIGIINAFNADYEKNLTIEADADAAADAVDAANRAKEIEVIIGLIVGIPLGIFGLVMMAAIVMACSSRCEQHNRAIRNSRETEKPTPPQVQAELIEEAPQNDTDIEMGSKHVLREKEDSGSDPKSREESSSREVAYPERSDEDSGNRPSLRQ